MNPMLDGYPDNYDGYLIHTDFRIGIQICQCLSDEELSEYERIATALYLLYGKGVPDAGTAQKGLSWFINVRDHFGVPVRLNCGYRCPKHNAQVSGASKTSKHMSGLAADIAVVGVHPMRVARYIETIPDSQVTSGVIHGTTNVTDLST